MPIGPSGVSFHHHDVVGARMARARMEALRYPTADIDEVARLVELHLRFHTYQMGWTDSALRRYARDAGALLDRLNELTRADCTTRNQAKARELERRMDELERAPRASFAEREALDAIRPELDGDAVMAQLGDPARARRRRARWSSCWRSGSRRALSAKRRRGAASTRWWERAAGAALRRGGSAPGGELLDHAVGLLVVVLHGRRLHEVGRRADERAAEAAVEADARRSARRR